MKHKSLSVKITDGDAGLVSAVFSTFNVKDSDGDVTLPDAFTEGQAVRISAFNHASWGAGHLPVGKGTIRTTDTEAILEARFFLDTEAGRDTFTVVKELGEIGEWSYGFDVLDSELGTFEGEPVTFLKAVKVHEVSPVILGAGVGTRTLSAKSRRLDLDDEAELLATASARFGDNKGRTAIADLDLDAGRVVFAVATTDSTKLLETELKSTDAGLELGEEAVEVKAETHYSPITPDAGATLSKQAETVLTDLTDLVDRAAAVQTMRQEQGKSIGATSREALSKLEPEIKRLAEVLDTEAAPHQSDSDALEIERARFNLRRITA